MTRRTEVIQLRVSTEEKERIERQATAAGMTPSEWIRTAASIPATQKLVPFMAAQERAGVERAPEEEGVGTPAEIQPAESKPQEPSERLYMCPAPGCNFQAKSPAAVCGQHGRKVG